MPGPRHPQTEGVRHVDATTPVLRGKSGVCSTNCRDLRRCSTRCDLGVAPRSIVLHRHFERLLGNPSLSRTPRRHGPVGRLQGTGPVRSTVSDVDVEMHRHGITELDILCSPHRRPDRHDVVSVLREHRRPPLRRADSSGDGDHAPAVADPRRVGRERLACRPRYHDEVPWAGPPPEPDLAVEAHVHATRLRSRCRTEALRLLDLVGEAWPRSRRQL